MTLNIGRSFTYMFDDEGWMKKIVIGGILFFIPIVNFTVLGYMLEALKRTADGMDIPLPEWEDFGGKFMKGLTFFVIGFIYQIPMMPLLCLNLGLMGVYVLGVGGVSDNEALMNMAPMLRACSNCVYLIYTVAVLFVAPAALIRYAMTGVFRSAFQFGKIFGFIRDNIANYIVALALAVVAVYIAYFGVIACFVGLLFTMFWYYLVMAHLLGQVQRESLAVS